MQLDAGEKSHFVISQDTTWEWADLVNGTAPQFIEARLSKGDEGLANALICKTSFTMTETEPLTMNSDSCDTRGKPRC